MQRAPSRTGCPVSYPFTILYYTIREDNQSCIALAKKFVVSRKTKHIRVRHHYVRQQVRDGIIALGYPLCG